MSNYINKMLLTTVAGLVALLPATGMDQPSFLVVEDSEWNELFPKTLENSQQENLNILDWQNNELIPWGSVQKATSNLEAYIKNGGKIDELILEKCFERYPLSGTNTFYLGQNTSDDLMLDDLMGENLATDSQINSAFAFRAFNAELLSLAVNEFYLQNRNRPLNTFNIQNSTEKRSIMDTAIANHHFHYAIKLFQFFLGRGGKLNERNIIEIMSLDDSSICHTDDSLSQKNDLLKNLVPLFIKQNGKITNDKDHNNNTFTKNLLDNDEDHNNNTFTKNLLDTAVAHKHLNSALSLYSYFIKQGGKINEQNIIEIMSQKNEILNSLDESHKNRILLLNGVVKTFIKQNGKITNDMVLNLAVKNGYVDVALKLYTFYLNQGGRIHGVNISWILLLKNIDLAQLVLPEFIKQNGSFTSHHLCAAYAWDFQIFSYMFRSIPCYKIPSQSVNSFLRFAHSNNVDVYNAIKLLLESGASYDQPVSYLGQDYPDSLSFINKYLNEIKNGENIKNLLIDEANKKIGWDFGIMPPFEIN